jgi:hypothetical protein
MDYAGREAALRIFKGRDYLSFYENPELGFLGHDLYREPLPRLVGMTGLADASEVGCVKPLVMKPRTPV